MRAEVAIGTIAISILTKPIAEVKDECDRQYMKFTREFNQRFTSIRLNIRSVNYCQSPGGEPLSSDKVQSFEGVFSRSLIVFVIRDKSSTEVGGKNFGGLEILPSKRGLAAARGSDQDN